MAIGNPSDPKNEFGIQPLDTILDRLSLKNDDLVRASGEQLTHKQVQKARKGRSITPNIKSKIVKALNTKMEDQQYTQENLFNY